MWFWQVTAVERPKPLGDLPASSDGWLRLSNKPASAIGNDRAKARRPVKEGYGMVVPFTGTCRPLVITFLRGEKWGWLRLWCFPIGLSGNSPASMDMGDAVLEERHLLL
ncbi:hypothetical protein NPIL_329911 [Nephila pilipes]|uniref:Uncharacterized protein n=1 Tax=Nephila pilipes TaxID=299642 RepID=A0A8X6N8P4_NEPPI|nr:hypothetical protein NPIL_329911 [Nephila pilipes]